MERWFCHRPIDWICRQRNMTYINDDGSLKKAKFLRSQHETLRFAVNLALRSKPPHCRLKTPGDRQHCGIPFGLRFQPSRPSHTADLSFPRYRSAHSSYLTQAFPFHLHTFRLRELKGFNSGRFFSRRFSRAPG